MEKDNEYSKVALEGVPLIGEPTRENDSRYNFPGNRRVPLANNGLPAGTVLIPTAGNALQAVPAATLVSDLEVVVGEDVVSPDYRGSAHDLQLSVVHGDTETPASATGQGSMEQPLSHTTASLPALDAGSSPSGHTDLVLVDVPDGVERGSSVVIQIPDGRLVGTTIPMDPTVKQFYVRVQP